MAIARITIATEYADPDANADFASDFPNEPAPAPVMVRPHPYVMSLDLDSLSSDVAVVPDTTASDEEIAIDFGDVAEATGFVVRNRTGQDLSVAVNGVLGGTPNGDVTSAATAIDSVLTTQLAILNAFDAMDPIADVIAAIATANAAIAAAQTDLSDAIAEDGTAIFTLPDGAVLAYAGPPDADTPVESLSLYTTATQAGDGEIDFSVFGSAAP